MRLLKYLLIAALALAPLPGVDAQSGWLPLVKAGGGGGGVSFAYRAKAVGGGGSSVGLAAMTIGTTVSSDIITLVVSNTNGGSGTVTSVTIKDGVGTVQSMNAVPNAADDTGVDTLSMWSVSGVVLGTTADVVVNSAGTMFTVGAIVGVISGSASPTPTAASTHVAASFADPFVISGTVPSGGIAIALVAQNGTLAGAWSNATQDQIFDRGTGTQDSLAHSALGTGGTLSPTYTGFGGNQNHGIMGVWGP